MKLKGIFLRHLLRQRRGVCIMSAILILQAAIGAATPWPMRFILDYVLMIDKKIMLQPQFLSVIQGHSAPWLLGAAVAVWLLIYLIGVLLGLGEQVWTARTINSIIEGTRNEIAGVLMTRRQGFVDRWRKADLVGRISNDTEKMELLLQTGLPVAVRALPSLVMTVSIVLTINYRIALILLVVIMAMMASTVYFAQRILKYRKRARQEVTHLEHLSYQALNAFSLIKSLILEKSWLGRVGDAAHTVSGHVYGAELASGLLAAWMTVIKISTKALILLIGGRAVLEGRQTVGTLLLFNSYVDSLNGPMKDLYKFSQKAASSLASIERIEDLLADAEGWEEKNGEEPLLLGGPATIRMEGVSFRYHETVPVLDRFNATFYPGEFIAVLGASGSGKTTFLKLLNRMLDVSEGHILLAGRPLTRLKLEELRSYVTVIAQETFFLPATIRENLAAACPGAGDEALAKALELVHAERFVSRLPAGLDTVILESGRALSAGQSKRLSAARAFLRPRRGVFAFDEATAGLDLRSAQVLLASAKALAREGAIVFWATHKNEEAEDADKTLVFTVAQNPTLRSGQDQKMPSGKIPSIIN